MHRSSRSFDDINKFLLKESLRGTTGTEPSFQGMQESNFRPLAIVLIHR